jgi:hypothetical protein
MKKEKENMSKKVKGKASSQISIKKIIKEELKPILKKLDKIEKDIKGIKKKLK